MIDGHKYVSDALAARVPTKGFFALHCKTDFKVREKNRRKQYLEFLF